MSYGDSFDSCRPLRWPRSGGNRAIQIDFNIISKKIGRKDDIFGCPNKMKIMLGNKRYMGYMGYCLTGLTTTQG
jgi:hypothetical protein